MTFSQITMAVSDSVLAAHFYRDMLVMTAQRDGLGYGVQQADHEFVQKQATLTSTDGFYYKIGINWHYNPQF